MVDWIQELPEDQIIAKYFVGPGDIYSKVDTAEWLLHAMRELGRLFSYQNTRSLNELLQRIRYGVKKDLLDLTNLKGIGRVRARALAQAGYRKTQDIIGIDVNKLAQVPTIGKQIATDIKLQLGEKVSGFKEVKKAQDDEIDGQKLLTDYD